MYLWIRYFALVISQRYVKYILVHSSKHLCYLFMSILIRRCFKTSIFSRFLKVAMATSNIITEVYIGGIVSGYSVSMLKETIALVWHYVYETRKEKAKLAERYMWNWNIKSFSNETINLFFRKFWASFIFDLVKSVWAPRIL